MTKDPHQAIVKGIIPFLDYASIVLEYRSLKEYISGGIVEIFFEILRGYN